jgi:hypothetical protein
VMGVSTPLMLLAHIANTQPGLTALPRKALQVGRAPARERGRAGAGRADDQ